MSCHTDFFSKSKISKQNFNIINVETAVVAGEGRNSVTTVTRLQAATVEIILIGFVSY